MNLQGKKAAFLGGSMTFGYSLSNTEEHLLGGLKAVFNHGISGTRFARQSDGRMVPTSISVTAPSKMCSTASTRHWPMWDKLYSNAGISGVNWMTAFALVETMMQ